MTVRISKAWLTSLALLLAAVCWLFDDSSHLSQSHFKRDVNHFLNARTDIYSMSNVLARNVSMLAGQAAAAAEDEDYSCSAAKPCSNGACCGEGGFCGYGPKYCGAGCVSNCNAVAECGQFAAEPGKTCPLNVCCSEFGFCGTLHDFCNDKCQSNCVEHPAPPEHKQGDVLKRVIGYYEGWNARSKCHESKPEDLPLDALTHINFAFAFVDPKSFELIPMTDGKTYDTVFTETTGLKSANPDLKIFISVGGWTFSDNGTETQPLLGHIAASQADRSLFASKIVDFLYKNNFDGIDLDWEYPGASDRGGKPEDTGNMVKLFAEIRSAFDKSGKDYQLSFTIPASYWYLRWFNVPALLKYADWTNLMSYDIHGLWDRDNAIGNKVQPHTNLTEIQLASELLWRAKVPPGKVNLGLGFYGRSFTLSDPSCTKPGCRFSDASRPGPCTKTGGFLAYYEIMDILEKNKDIKLEHDEEAAVKYFAWDKDQWISFDDKETFAQKVKWANEVGMAGILIWASDLDDYTFSAHSGLLGREIKSNNNYSPGGGLPGNVVLHQRVDGATLAATNYHESCHIFDECVDPDIVRCSSHFPGTVSVGNDYAGCGKGYVKPICCKKEIAPKTCKWRGGGADCNGQCHNEEVTLFRSRYGGGPDSESGTRKCNRGDKVFCCEDERFSALTGACAWSKCGAKCASDEMEVAQAVNVDGQCGTFDDPQMRYCCKGKKAPLENCHWIGKGDCADNSCSATETTLLVDHRGNQGGWVCNWGRSPTLCCTPNTSVFEKATCGVRSSDPKLGSGFRTGMDPYADSDEEDDDGVTARSELAVAGDTHSLDTRAGKPEPYNSEILSLISGTYVILRILARSYPGITHLDDSTNGRPPHNLVFRPRGNNCANPSVESATLSSVTRSERLGQSYGGTGTGYDTEHNPDRQYVSDLLHFASRGRLPDGTPVIHQVNGDNIVADWNRQLPPNTFPRGDRGARDTRTPNAYFFDQFGSTTNRQGLMGADRDMNQMKGNIFNFNANIQDQNVFNNNLQGFISGLVTEDVLFQRIRAAIEVFEYIHHDDALPVIQANRRALRTAATNIEQAVPSLRGFATYQAEFDSNWYLALTTRAYSWLHSHLNQIRSALQQPSVANTPRAISALAIIDELYLALVIVRPPPDI